MTGNCARFRAHRIQVRGLHFHVCKVMSSDSNPKLLTLLQQRERARVWGELFCSDSECPILHGCLVTTLPSAAGPAPRVLLGCPGDCFNFRFNSTPTSRTQGSTNGRSSCRALGSGTLCSSLGPGNSIFEPWVRERYTRTRLHCQESTGGNLKSTLSPVEWLGVSNGILHLNPRAAATPSSPSSTRPPRPRPAVQPIYVGLLLTFERRDRGLGSGH